MCDLPAEILFKIFRCISGEDIGRCRRVCKWWKQIVDETSDKIWHEFCLVEFPVVSEYAYSKANPELSWFSVYKSLTRWPKLLEAKVVKSEIAHSHGYNENILGFQLLKDGIIGVHKISSITYYDVNTSKVLHERTISGDFMRYEETENFVFLLNDNYQLYVKDKKGENLSNHLLASNIAFYGVKTFIICETVLYFVTLNNVLFQVKLDSKTLEKHFIVNFEESILSLGKKNNRINVFTVNCNILTVENNRAIRVCHLGRQANFLEYLHQYNLLQYFDWKIYSKLRTLTQFKSPLLHNIVTMRSHGAVLLVGTSEGCLRVGYVPNNLGIFDFYNIHVIDKYFFVSEDNGYCRGTVTRGPIYKIDVMEIDNGHKVYIALRDKIVILNFKH